MSGFLIIIGRIISYLWWSIKIRDGMKLEDSSSTYISQNSRGRICCLSVFFRFRSNTRVPERVMNKYGKKIARLNKCLAGEKLVFCTNAMDIGIEIVYKDKITSANMSQNGSCGLDVYEERDGQIRWIRCLSPKNEIDMYCKEKIKLTHGWKKMHIYLPPYASISKLNIIIKKNEMIEKDIQQNAKDKMAIYGSSISQGCSASRPGLAYSNILGRLLDKEIINLGFSESALGQDQIVEYVAGLKAQIYIIEYDHNASVTLLERNHYKVYQTIRDKNRESKIILLSRFSGGLSITKKEEEQRITIINDTFMRAIDEGDTNILFLCGKNTLRDFEEKFADDRHPNDAGMLEIAQMIANALKEET